MTNAVYMEPSSGKTSFIGDSIYKTTQIKHYGAHNVCSMFLSCCSLCPFLKYFEHIVECNTIIILFYCIKVEDIMQRLTREHGTGWDTTAAQQMVDGAQQRGR